MATKSRIAAIVGPSWSRLPSRLPPSWCSGRRRVRRATSRLETRTGRVLNAAPALPGGYAPAPGAGFDVVYFGNAEEFAGFVRGPDASGISDRAKRGRRARHRAWRASPTRRAFSMSQ